MSQVGFRDTLGVRPVARKTKKQDRQLSAAELKAIGNRLRWFREASGFATHSKFIRGTTFSRTAYVGWEGGKYRIGLDSALELVAKHPHLSLDYIYLGRTGAITSLPLQLAIAELMRQGN